MTKGRGYLVPEPIDPGDTVCVRVYVPNDQLYMAAFLRAYEFFGQWVAWERDVTGKAAAAAAVWRQAIDKTLAELDCSGGDCGIMDIRQSSAVPCIIEKKAECSEEWEQAVDMRLCVPKMRISNGVLQQDTTGNGDWQNAGDPDDPYDPREDAPAPAPWPEPPAGETGQCLSAANVATYIDFCAYQFAASMVNGLTFFQTLSAAMVILTALMGLIPLTALTALITALYEQVVDSWEDVRDHNVIGKLTEILFCKYSADGSMTKAHFDDVIAEATSYRSGLPDADERAKWFIVIGLMELWGPVGMTISGKIWGITTYECNENVCEWDITWNATNGWGDWETLPSEPIGELVNGVWTCVDGVEDDNETGRECQLYLQLPEEQMITYFEFGYTLTKGTVENTGIACIQMQPPSPPFTGAFYEMVNGASTYGPWEDYTVSEFKIFLRTDHDTENPARWPFTGAGTIEWVRAKGLGTPPNQ